MIADLSRRQGTDAEKLAFFEEHRRTVTDQLARTTRHLAAIDAKIAAYSAAVSGEKK